MLFTSLKGDNRLYIKMNTPNVLMVNRNAYRPMLQQHTDNNARSQNTPKPHLYPRNVIQNEYKPNEYDSSKPKPMKWGEPTWFLFHTLAEKVKEDSFPLIRNELLDVCYTICINLPCSICANHAKEYMNNINYRSIKTKEEFIRLFYNFHNTVNARKNYQQFPYEMLGEKYRASITINIIRNFVYHFQEKYKAIRLMSDQIHRKLLSDNMKTWFNNNIHHFDV